MTECVARRPRADLVFDACTGEWGRSTASAAPGRGAGAARGTGGARRAMGRRTRGVGDLHGSRRRVVVATCDGDSSPVSSCTWPRCTRTSLRRDAVRRAAPRPAPGVRRHRPGDRDGGQVATTDLAAPDERTTGPSALPGPACGPAILMDGGVWGGVMVDGAAGCRAGRVARLVDRGGAGPVASVVVAVRLGPLEDAGLDHPVTPGGVGLEAVVEPAQRGEVVGLRRTGLWSPLRLGVGVVRDDVVDVAAPGRAGAPGEHARPVAEDDLLADPVGDLVAPVWSWVLRSMTGLMVTLVRESAHQSLTWSSSTSRWPSSIRPVGPNTVARPSRVASKWAWRTTSRAAGRPRRLGAGGALAEVERGLGAGEVAEGSGPAGVRATPRTRGPSATAAPWASARSRSRASAMSSSASSRIVPAKWTSSSWIVAWRGSTWR